MVVEYDARHQRLLVSDDKGTVMLTMDGPTPADVLYWQDAARRRVVA